MNELNNQLAYVVGDSYSGLSQLPGVLTVTQFFKAVFDGSLPMHFTWMLGQGVTNVEENLLKLCKTHCSEIRFYGIDEMTSTQLSQVDIPKSIFSTLSKFMVSIVHCLGFSR